MRVIKHVVQLFAARTANPASTLLIGLAIAKMGGVDPFGHYSFILAYCFLFSVVFSLGLGTLVTRDTAQQPQRKSEYFSNASFICLISSGIGLAIMLLLGSFFKLPQQARYALVLMSVSIVPSTLIFVWEALLVTFEKNQYIFAVQGIEAALKLTAGYVLLTQGYGIVALMVLFLVLRFISGVIYFFVLRRVLAPLVIRIDWGVVRNLLQLAPTFAGLYIFSVLFSKIGMIMLPLIQDFHAVGIYTAAYKLLEISFLFPTCVITVLFPILARHAKESPKEFSRFSANGVFYSTAVLLPVIFGCMYWAEPIIFRIYSEEFALAILPFRILIVTLGLYLTDQIFAHSLIARDYQGLNLRALMSATVLNVVCNLVLIPRYSYTGAAISTLVSMAALMLVHHILLIRRRVYQFDYPKMLAGLAAATAAGGLVMLVPKLSMGVSVTLACLTYLGCVVLVKRIWPKYSRVWDSEQPAESVGALEGTG